MEILSEGQLLVANIGNAGNFFLRLLGWFNPAYSHRSGVLIYPCNAVHTVGMRRTIDVVFVDDKKVVRKVIEKLRPFRMASCRAARYALELPSGMAAIYGFIEGQIVEFTDA